jgi:hypothetical protein
MVRSLRDTAAMNVLHAGVSLYASGDAQKTRASGARAYAIARGELRSIGTRDFARTLGSPEGRHRSADGGTEDPHVCSAERTW